MYRTGHYGVALLVYAPVGAALAVAGYGGAAVTGAAAMLVLTPLPDYDQRVPLISHRGVTHTVAFALLIGGALAVVALALPPDVTSPVGGRYPVAAFGFFVGTLAVGAHLLADVLTPAGVTLFWPVSGRTYSLGWTRAANPVANYLLLAVGVLAAAGAATFVRTLQ